MAWLGAAEEADWSNLIEVRRTFPHADSAIVRSGNTVTIFNIAGNKFRLVAAIKYRQQVIYTLALITHAEYDKGQWKDKL
jgi:mRNA interferase HigB